MDIYRKKIMQICVIAMSFLLVCNLFITDAYAAGGKKPGKIKKIQCVTTTDSTVTVSWSKSKKANNYQIGYKPGNAKKYLYIKTGNVRTFTISGLAPGSRYDVKVRGLKGKKKGAWSKVKKCYTAAAAPAPAPTPSVTPGTNPEPTPVPDPVPDPGDVTPIPPEPYIEEPDDFDYSKALEAEEKQVEVVVNDTEAQVSIEPIPGESGEAVLVGVEANEYLAGDSHDGVTDADTVGTELVTFDLSSGVSEKLEPTTAKGMSRLYEKYYVIRKGTNEIVKGPIYPSAENLTTNEVEIPTTTKKGVIHEFDEDTYNSIKDLGCQWTAVNIDFSGLIIDRNRVDEGGRVDTIDVNGKTFYIDRDYISGLDSLLSRYENEGVNVVAVVISFVEGEKGARYPRELKYIDNARWTNGFNTSNEEGRDYFIAGMEYLAKRYSGNGHGRICSYVIGNEVDYAYDWYEIEPNKNGTEVRSPFETFMEEYYRTLRLANQAVKKYGKDITVGASISKDWALSTYEQQKTLYPGVELSDMGDMAKVYDSYSPKKILDWLNYYSKKEGDFDWVVVPHNYPAADGEVKAGMEDYRDASAPYFDSTFEFGGYKIVTGDPDTTWQITQNNLEVLQLYLDREENRFNGKPRSLYFTENGTSSGTDLNPPTEEEQRIQAASVAQYFYRANKLPSTKAIIYYKLRDRDGEGSTSFRLGLKDINGNPKLSYYVWKAVDKENSFETTNEYLRDIKFVKNGQLYTQENGKINSYLDVMKMFDSSFDWDSIWN